MIRFWGLVLALVLVVGCANAQPHYTLRHPGMNYTEFLARAEKMVAEKYPEWYVEGIQRALVFNNPDIRFASVSKQEDGTFVMYIYEQSWDLCTVEDLASVLLHEYVHIKIWNDLEDQIPGDGVAAFCRAAVHEMTAYGTELRQTRIKTTSAMRSSTRMGYALAYGEGSMYCSSEIMKGFSRPRMP